MHSFTCTTAARERPRCPGPMYSHALRVLCRAVLQPGCRRITAKTVDARAPCTYMPCDSCAELCCSRVGGATCSVAAGLSAQHAAVPSHVRHRANIAWQTLHATRGQQRKQTGNDGPCTETTTETNVIAPTAQQDGGGGAARRDATQSEARRSEAKRSEANWRGAGDQCGRSTRQQT